MARRIRLAGAGVNARRRVIVAQATFGARTSKQCLISRSFHLTCSSLLRPDNPLSSRDRNLDPHDEMRFNDVLSSLLDVVDPRLSQCDLDIIKMLNMADPDHEIEWKQQDADFVIALFTYIFGWMRFAGGTSGKAGSAPGRKS